MILCIAAVVLDVVWLVLAGMDRLSPRTIELYARSVRSCTFSDPECVVPSGDRSGKAVFNVARPTPRGSSTQNVEPSPTLDRTPSRPPLSFTIWRTRARPRPVPLPPISKKKKASQLPVSLHTIKEPTLLSPLLSLCERSYKKNISQSQLQVPNQLTEKLALDHIPRSNPNPSIRDFDPNNNIFQRRMGLVMLHIMLRQITGRQRMLLVSLRKNHHRFRYWRSERV